MKDAEPIKTNLEQWEAEVDEMAKRRPTVGVATSPRTWGMVITVLLHASKDARYSPEARARLEEVAQDMMAMFPPEMKHIHARFEEVKNR